jgi:hypothetical protein
VAAIEASGVGGQDRQKHPGQRVRASAKRQVNVIVHQAESEHPETKPALCPLEPC